MLFGKKKSVAGLDVGSSSVKVVELRRQTEQFKPRESRFRESSGRHNR